jgi:hypothetical protein
MPVRREKEATMTLSTLADDAAIVLGIAFVIWMIWLLASSSRRGDVDPAAWHDQAAETRRASQLHLRCAATDDPIARNGRAPEVRTTRTSLGPEAPRRWDCD